MDKTEWQTNKTQKQRGTKVRMTANKTIYSNGCKSSFILGAKQGVHAWWQGLS